MPGVYERKLDLDFSGGLNTVDPPTEIKDSELVVCDNFWYPDGVLAKRPGFFNITASSLGSGSHVILGYDPNNTKYLIATRNGTSVSLLDIDGTLVAVTGAITQGACWTLHISGTTYIGFDGSMGVRILTASAIGAATIANSPQSQMGIFHKNRIFTNVYGVPGRIAFSSSITPLAPVATWAAADTVNINTSEKDIITGLASVGDLLIIFFRHSTWILYVQGDSPGNWVVRRINNVIGAAPSIANASVYVYGSEVYFISKDGVYKTNGSSFVNLSEKIWDAFDNLYAINYNISVSGHWRVTEWNGNIVVIGQTGFGTYNYIYSVRLGAWTSWNFIPGVGFGFDDMFGDINSTSVSAGLIAIQTNLAYYVGDVSVSDYDFLLSNGINSYADGFLINTVGTGAAYTSTFQTKEFTVGVDELLRSKYMGLEYIARASPTFKAVIDGTVGPAQTPGFHATLRKGYKISGGGRGRTLALKGEHALTSPYEFYRGAIHLTSKVPILASGTP